MKNLKIWKAIFCGNRHLARRLPCQDYAAYSISADNCLVLCLSDGAGGARYAELASHGNVNAVLGFFRTNRFQDFLNESPLQRACLVIEECCNSLVNIAARYDVNDLSQLSATLAFAVIGKGKIYIGHIGDGIIAAKNGDTLRFLSEPQNIGGMSNRTHFTCERNAVKHYRESIIAANEFDSLLLCSDGPYNDISAKTDLNTALTSLLTEIADNKIANDIEFQEKVASLAEIRDDWSILALSLKRSNLFQNKTLYSL